MGPKESSWGPITGPKDCVLPHTHLPPHFRGLGREGDRGRRLQSPPIDQLRGRVPGLIKALHGVSYSEASELWPTRRPENVVSGGEDLRFFGSWNRHSVGRAGCFPPEGAIMGWGRVLEVLHHSSQGHLQGARPSPSMNSCPWRRLRSTECHLGRS